jgi:hypothetical protein
VADAVSAVSEALEIRKRIGVPPSLPAKSLLVLATSVPPEAPGPLIVNLPTPLLIEPVSSTPGT